MVIKPHASNSYTVITTQLIILAGGAIPRFRRRWNPTPSASLRAGSNVENHCQLAHIKGFTYYGFVNITLSIDEELVKEVRKIAIERDTTLTGLVRSYLHELAAEHAKSGRRRRELEALERSFEQFQFNVGKRTWKREDLHERR